MSNPVELTQGSTYLTEPAEGRASTTAQPKSLLVTKLLRRGKGATIPELQEVTGWQPHSVRAFLSGLRKKGQVLVKEQRKSGDTAYLITSRKAATGTADA
jgi:hypothetical protein